MKIVTTLLLGLLLMSVGFCEDTAPSTTTTSTPFSGADIVKKIRPDHPRLMATAEDFRLLRDKLDWQSEIQKKADEILSEPPVKYELPDGVRLLAISRRVLERSQTLGMAYQLTQDVRYRDRLWHEMEAVTQFADWHPVHYLDTAEMTAAVAIAYDWLYNTWTPEQRQILRTAIVEKGLNTALPFYREHKWWTKVEHNWNQVCNGGIGMGALAVAEDEPALAGEILQSAIESLPLAMKHYAPDGAWAEGPGYWNYATTYTVYFLASLETATGSEWGLDTIPGFSLAGDFPLYMNGPSGHSFNFADAGDGPAHGSAMFWLATKFNRNDYAYFELQFAHKSPTALDGLWGTRWNHLDFKLMFRPQNKYFRDAEVAVLRSYETPAFYVGFKAGDNKVNHCHLDCGSFVLDALGKRWVTDLGPDDYNLPGYFGKNRWTYYRLRAEGHNTLVLNPDEQPDQDPKAKTVITRFSDKSSHPFAIADLTPAYARNASSVLRGIALLDPATVLVQDEIKADKPVNVWWFIHTAAAIRLNANSRTAQLTLDDKHLSIRIISPKEATFQIMEAAPLPTSPHPTGQLAKGNHIQKLDVQLSGVRDTTIAVIFSELDTYTPNIFPISEWQ